MPTAKKYFCIAEQTAHYLQKYIVVKRRKGFKGKGTAKDPNFMADFFKKNAYKYKEALIAKTLPSDLSDIPSTHYDRIPFFSPSGIKALFKNFPKFEQKDVKLVCFGAATAQLFKELGCTPAIEAPLPNVPSMVGALALYLKGLSMIDEPIAHS